MSFYNRLKRTVFRKEILVLFGIFLLAGTELYGDILPFGISAFAAWSNSAVGILSCLLGIIKARVGFISYLRHIFSFAFYVITRRRVKGKIPDFLLTGSSVLVGGAISLLLLKEGRILYFGFAFFEAIFSAVFTVIFKRSKDVLEDKLQGKSITEGDFAFAIITLMCLILSFSDIESGRLSVSASLMVVTGMASAFIHKAPVSGAVNMAAGFFTLIFTPFHPASVAYLTLSGFTGSLLKKYGKFAIPVTYMVMMLLFSLMDVNTTTFYLEDVVTASVLFLLLPVRFLKLMDTVPDNYLKQEASFMISERLSSLAETFCSVPEVFSRIDLRTKDLELKEASAITVENVCGDCVFRGNCSKKAEEVLRRTASEEMFRDDVACVRKRELLTAFKNNLRLFRMEGMLKNYIKEESAALSGQMECIGKTLKELSSEKESKILRDNGAETEILAELKKNGIYVKKIRAGKNSKGVFGITLEMRHPADDEVCDEMIPGILKKVLGFEVVRYGIKECEPFRVSYTEIPLYKFEKGASFMSYEDVSGDSFSFAYTDREHFAVILSDGMGTGAKAKYKSNAATELATRLLSAGMNLPTSVSMVNSLLLRQGGRDFVTLDIALMDIETGTVQFTKNASATGYLLKCGGRVIKLEAKGNPLGILGKTETEVNEIRMYEGDFLILVSDGVSECFSGGESELSGKIGEFTGGGAQSLSDFILSEAIRSGGKKIKDDITVVTVGCIKKQKSGKTMKKGGLVYEK